VTLSTDELLQFVFDTTLNYQYIFLISGVITSTNFPNNYPNNHKKTEIISVGVGLVIALKFTAFDVESHSDCRYDHLVIEDGDGTTLMEKMCGTTLPSDVVSKSNVVKLHFTTDGDTTKPGWRVTWTARKSATVVFSSVAGAAEWQGSSLGEFVKAGEHLGRPFYKQRDTEGSSNRFLYSEGGRWWVSDTLGRLGGNMKNNQNTNLPMTTNWLYVSRADYEWDWRDNDRSLTLEFTSLSPCKLVRVAGNQDAVEKVGSSLGDYRFAFVLVFCNLKKV